MDFDGMEAFFRWTGVALLVMLVISITAVGYGIFVTLTAPTCGVAG